MSSVSSISYSSSEDELINVNEPDNNIIGNIYKSMSNIIESLNVNNLLLTHQVNKIKQDLNNITTTMHEIKLNNQEMINTYTSEISSIMEQLENITEKENKLNNEVVKIKKRNYTTLDLQKQILDTRTLLLQAMNNNIKKIKSELNEDNLRIYIRDLVNKEIDKRLEKKYRTNKLL